MPSSGFGAPSGSYSFASIDEIYVVIEEEKDALLTAVQSKVYDNTLFGPHSVLALMLQY
jgi:hypothetical protein